MPDDERINIAFNTSHAMMTNGPCWACFWWRPLDIYVNMPADEGLCHGVPPVLVTEPNVAPFPRVKRHHTCPNWAAKDPNWLFMAPEGEDDDRDSDT